MDDPAQAEIDGLLLRSGTDPETRIVRYWTLQAWVRLHDDSTVEFVRAAA